MKVITVINAKGGCGKSTIAAGLATGLARYGHRVLFMDLDPQAQVTQWFGGGDGLSAAGTLVAALTRQQTLTDVIQATGFENLSFVASADGLELLTRENKWFPVTAFGEDLVVNVGDMLQRLTNNKLKSTTHRVVNPPMELMKNSRYSVPFFLHPVPGMDLTCLESCISEHHPKQYFDITAGGYLDERLREIGLKK